MSKIKFKTLTPEMVEKIEAEVKVMLHASRDTMRNRFMFNPSRPNPKTCSYNCNCGNYGEAFGIMRCLVVMGFGYWGSDNLNAVQEQRSDNPKHNVKWWFHKLTQEVLNEENFRGSGHCDYCMKKYGKDDSGRSAALK